MNLLTDEPLKPARICFKILVMVGFLLATTPSKVSSVGAGQVVSSSVPTLDSVPTELRLGERGRKAKTPVSQTGDAGAMPASRTNNGGERKEATAEVASPDAESRDSLSIPSESSGRGGATPPAPSSCEQYRPLLEKYDWDADLMFEIMKLENRPCDPFNHNRNEPHEGCNWSAGLFQIACVHGYEMAWLEDPENNVEAAYNVFKKQGYTAWSVYDQAKKELLKKE